jgi:DNA-binding IclR family transcriptional regulator
MAAMQEAGFLDRDADGGRYRLGIRLAAYGQLAQLSTPIQRVASPLVEQLARRTRETASLNELVGNEVVNTVAFESAQAIHAAGGLGIPLPLHATAAGKVLTAWRPPEELHRLLPLRLDQFTPETVADAAVLTEQLAEVRAKGYAVARGELARDLMAVSAPVRDSRGRVAAAVSVAGPVSRLGEPEIPRVVKELIETADAISAGLGYRAEIWAEADGDGSR